MAKTHTAKVGEIQRAMQALGRRLDAGDASDPIVIVIPGQLGCTYRPLRRDPEFGGEQREVPQEAAPRLEWWLDRLRSCGTKAILSLMGPAEHLHYTAVVSALGAGDLLQLYERHGFEVRSVPWADPKYKVALGGPSYQQQLLAIREEALHAFDGLPKPVVLHCSSGIQRSAPVAAFIYSERAGQRDGAER